MDKAIGPCEECGHDEGGESVVLCDELGAFLCRDCLTELAPSLAQEYWEGW